MDPGDATYRLGGGWIFGVMALVGGRMFKLVEGIYVCRSHQSHYRTNQPGRSGAKNEILA